MAGVQPDLRSGAAVAWAVCTRSSDLSALGRFPAARASCRAHNCSRRGPSGAAAEGEVPPPALKTKGPLMKNYLTPAELQSALALRDLSDPAQGPHAMSLLLADVTAALERLWGIGVETHRLSPLVATADNYDRLGYSPDDVTRDSRYSRHVSPTVMLRSHTSAGMPALLDSLRQRNGPLRPAACAARPGVPAGLDRPHPRRRPAPGGSVEAQSARPAGSRRTGRR